MQPTLFRIGSVSIFSYPFMLSLAYILGILIAVWSCNRRVLSLRNIFGLCITVQISGTIGSRLLFAINNYSRFESNPGLVFRPSPGGFAFSGGLFLGILAAILYLKLARLSFWRVSDCAVTSIAIGIAIAKIGCFLGGCCFGKETSSFLGVQFPPNSPAAQKYGFPHLVQPAQLYEAGASLVILAVIVLFLAKRKKFEGQLFLYFMILFLSARAVNESLRGDVRHNYFFNLSQSQFLDIILVVLAIVMFMTRLKAAKTGKHISQQQI